MNDEHRKIIISEYRQDASGEYHQVPLSPVNRWLTYAMLVPVLVVLVLIGIFFFAAFLALLAIAVVVVGLRFWWLHRKYQQTAQQFDEGGTRAHEKESSVNIEDAQIVEERESYQPHRPRQ